MHEGGCLCGAVQYRVAGEPMLDGVCHCTLCKRRTGSAFGISTYFAKANVQISGELKTYEYRSDESHRWIRMEFCPSCGTSIAATAEALPDLRWIAGGTFNEPNWIKPSGHGWTRSALHWMVFPPDVELADTTRIKTANRQPQFRQNRPSPVRKDKEVAEGAPFTEMHEGGCLCGAVRYQAEGAPQLTGICHCTLCKHITGSAFSIPAYFNGTAVQITKGTLNAYQYCSDESGRWIKLEFCTNCGTTVMWTAEWFPGTRAIGAGTLDDPNWIKPIMHIWTRSALDWMAYPPDAQLVETTP